MSERNCGTCKWLRAPEGERRRKYRMFHCDVPRPILPPIPSSFHDPRLPVLPALANMMCPSYGELCPAWERLMKPEKSTGENHAHV